MPRQQPPGLAPLVSRDAERWLEDGARLACRDALV